MNIKKFLPSLLNSWEIGQGKVFGRVNGIISLGLVFMTWLTVNGFEFPNWFLLVFMLLVASGFLISGFLYEKLGFYRVEANRYANINPVQKEMLEKIRILEERTR